MLTETVFQKDLFLFLLTFFNKNWILVLVLVLVYYPVKYSYLEVQADVITITNHYATSRDGAQVMN